MLQAIGNVMDLPGSMVRDAMTLNNPLDQLLDPMGSSNRTSGEQMLQGLGMDPGHSILGTVLEMALDPTTYAGVGLASRGVKALRLGSKAAGAYGKAKAATQALRDVGGAKAAAQAAVNSVKSGAASAINAAKAVKQSPMNVDRLLRGRSPILGTTPLTTGTPWSMDSARRLASRTGALAAERGQQLGNLAIDTAYNAIPGARDLTLAAALGIPTMNRMGGMGEEIADSVDPGPTYSGPMIPGGARFSMSGMNPGEAPMPLPDWATRYRYSLAGTR